MPNTKHNKYVSVTDWFATPPTSLQTGSAQQSVSRPSSLTGGGGGGNWGSTAVPPSSGGYSLEEIQSIVETYGSSFFLRKDRDDTANGVITFNDQVKSNDFAQGNLMGAGWSIYRDGNNSVVIETDRIIVRKDMTVSELIVNQETFQKGSTIYVKAGCTLTGIEDRGTYYRCYYDNKDGDEFSGFVENDLARCQRYDKSYAQVVKYYWRKVVGVGDNYVDLSKIDSEYDGVGIPEEGDDIAQLGNTEDKTRQSAVVISPDNGGSIIIWAGINSFSLSEKNMVGMGVDPSSGKAYIYGYGDLYFGDRNQEQFINYSPEDGLHINGTLSIGTKFGDKTLQDVIDSATPDGYEEFVSNVTDELDDIKVNIDGVETSIIDLQKQLDGAIETWFYEGIPTLENAPAFNWTTDELKNAHLGDLYYNKTTGKAYRFQMDGTVYLWVEITDTDIQAAMQAANAAQDTADNKRRVFITTPYPPYDKGDLWSRGSEYPLMICVVPKESGNYVESDWDYADNIETVKQEMQTLVETTTSTLNNKIGQANEAISKLDDDLSDAKTDLQGALDELNNAKDNIESIYDWAKKDGEFTDIEKVALDAANSQAIASINLYDTLVKAWADGEVTEDEQIKIDGAKASLQAAKDYADQKADEAFAQIAGYEYLKKALKEDTTVEGGLIQTSLLKLGYTNELGQRVTMSGTNGVYNSNAIGGGVASWWGGDIYDLLDYYTWDGNKWNPKSNVTIPTNIPSGLVRFDGTGYFAKGNLWWEEDGTLHADPSALFLSFDVNAKEGTLAATILNIESTIAKFSDMWEVKEDSNGNEYLFAKRSVVTQGGLTQYADLTGLDIEGIYDGIPIDGQTIYWEYDSDGKKTVLKAKVAEGGITNITSQMVVEALGYTPYDASNPNGYITSAALSGYATQTWVNQQGYLTEHQDLSAYLTKATASSTYQTKITSSNMLSYYLLSNTPDLSVYALKTEIPTSLKNPYALSWSGYSSGSYDGSVAKSFVIPSNTNQLTNGAGFITSAALADYLPLSGGTLTGPLTMKGGQYTGNYSLNMSNSDIIGVNAIFMSDTAEEGTEGIQFLRSNNTYDSLWALDGTLYFSPNGNNLSRTGSYSNNYKIWHSGNDGAGSGLDADLLDGVQYQNILERHTSGISTFSAVGWYRIAVCKLTASSGSTFSLYITRTYNNGNNEAYIFNITHTFSHNFCITQVAGDFSKQFITAIRIDSSSSTSQVSYVDIYYSGSVSNSIRWYTVGAATSYTTATPVSATTGTELSMDTVRGTKTITNGETHLSVGSTTNSIASLNFYNSNTFAWQISSRDSSQNNELRFYYYNPSTSSWLNSMSLSTDGRVHTYYGITDTGSSRDVGLVCQGSSYKLGFIIGSGNTNRGIYDYTNNSWLLYRDASTNVLIPQGNLGIGTTSPKALLHVEGNSYLRGTIYVTNPDATTINQSSGKIKFNSINANDGYRSPYIQAIYYGTYERKRLGIFQSNATNYTDDFVEVFTILPNGNVGIGTTSPSQKLDVNGVIRAEQYIQIGATLAQYNTSRTELSVVSKSAAPCDIFLGADSTRYWGFTARNATDASIPKYFGIYNMIAGSYVLTINPSNGYVGIGSNVYSPSAQLHVAGNVLATGGITQYSDIRKKTKLQDVELTLKQVANAPLIEHYYNSDDKKTTHVGSIAQYWAGMNDWFCKLDSDGFYTMEIQNAALASAISVARELERYESKTDKKIRMLKKRINELEDEIEKLKNIA